MRIKQQVTGVYILVAFLSGIVIPKDVTLNENDTKSLWVESFRDEEIEVSHRTDSLSMMILITLLILSVMTDWIFKIKNITFLHETGMSLLLGIITGGCIRLALSSISDKKQEFGNTVHIYVKNADKLGVAPTRLLMNISDVEYMYTIDGKRTRNKHDPKGNYENLQEKSSFNPDVFFFILLPPIVFFAGYELQKHYFFRNIGSIVTFAFFGTIISCVSTGALTYLYGNKITKIQGLTLNEGMLFGAMISATDPVTVLAIFNSLKVDNDLSALVFGESVINDAVAITLYRTIIGYMGFGKHNDNNNNNNNNEFIIESLLKAIGEFIYVFIGSFAIGTVVACFNALLTKLTKIGMFPLLETTLLILMSYSTFLIAEVANWSGIVAVLSCGIIQKHYTYYNMSLATALRFTQFFELINFIAETFIFSYIGLSVFLFTEHCWNWGFICWTIFITQVTRAINIYPLSFLLNIGRNPPISFRHMHILSWSGLRGAMAFALAIRNTSSDVRKLMLTATLSCVVFSVIVQGGLTLPLVKLLGIRTGVNKDEEENDHEGKCEWSTLISREQTTVNNLVLSKNLSNFQIGNKSPSVSEEVLDSFQMEHSENQPHKTHNVMKLFQHIDIKYLRPFFTVDSESGS